MEFYSAKELRFTGLYKWWAKKSEVEEILEKLSSTLTFSEIKPYIEHEKVDDKDYYCIYVGIANPKPVLARVIAQHIYGSGKSTLRKTLTSLLGTKKAVDDFIDNLFVGFEKSSVGKKDLEKFEATLINSEVHILNLDKNYYESVTDKVVRDKLLQLRKQISKLRSEL